MTLPLQYTPQRRRSIGKQGGGTGDVDPQICCDGAIGTPNVSVIVRMMSGEVRMGFLMEKLLRNYAAGLREEDVEFGERFRKYIKARALSQRSEFARKKRNPNLGGAEIRTTENCIVPVPARVKIIRGPPIGGLETAHPRTCPSKSASSGVTSRHSPRQVAQRFLGRAKRPAEPPHPPTPHDEDSASFTRSMNPGVELPGRREGHHHSTTQGQDHLCVPGSPYTGTYFISRRATCARTVNAHPERHTPAPDSVLPYPSATPAPPRVCLDAAPYTTSGVDLRTRSTRQKHIATRRNACLQARPTPPSRVWCGATAPLRITRIATRKLDRCTSTPRCMMPPRAPQHRGTPRLPQASAPGVRGRLARRTIGGATHSPPSQDFASRPHSGITRKPRVRTLPPQSLFARQRPDRTLSPYERKTLASTVLMYFLGWAVRRG
ncbi:hypothetical protein B0H14DRAFT_3751703 [Mycena olivaceomarginata]|nr:hypothetical protein B0H14DRAFT_3751703 [Mycena olivaceomarginata]